VPGSQSSWKLFEARYAAKKRWLGTPKFDAVAPIKNHGLCASNSSCLPFASCVTFTRLTILASRELLVRANLGIIELIRKKSNANCP
jgi:hypothetical protein